MELLQEITKKKNRTKLYLFLASIFLIFLTLFFVTELIVFENKNNLFNKLNEIENKNFNEISLILNQNINKELCLENDKVISCDKIIYTQWFGFSNYKLEIVQINEKISYKIIENNISIISFIFEIIILIVITIFITYFFLLLVFFIMDKYDKLLKSEWQKLQRIKEEIEKLENIDSAKFKKKVEELEKEKLELEIKLKGKLGGEAYIRKKIYYELANYYHPDKKTGNEEIFKKINNARDNEDDIALFNIYKNYLSKINAPIIEFNNLSISFEREEEDYQKRKLDEIDTQLKDFKKVKINGNIYILNDRGYLKYENPNPKSENFLHRVIAKKKLFNENIFPKHKFSNLEVHHIKTDQKLNCFTNNLVILTKEEHKRIHTNDYIGKFSEKKAVEKILSERNFKT